MFSAKCFYLCVLYQCKVSSAKTFSHEQEKLITMMVKYKLGTFLLSVVAVVGYKQRNYTSVTLLEIVLNAQRIKEFTPRVRNEINVLAHRHFALY